MAGDDALFESLITPGDTVVDVGANIGTMSLLASRKAARVIAVEPHPRTYKYLLGNISLNHVDNILTVNAACSDQSGTLIFSDLRTDDMNHVSSSGITVPAMSLDDLLMDVPEIGVLKVDAEGFELPIFRGANSVLAKTRVVFFEAWESHLRRYGHTTSQVIAELRKHGFSIFTDQRQCLPDSFVAETCQNLIALRQ